PACGTQSHWSCVALSTSTGGLHVLSCVPPRSANTGIAGCSTGVAAICHAIGDLIRVGVRLFIARSCRRLLPAIFVVQSAENGTSDHLQILHRATVSLARLYAALSSVGNARSQAAVWASGIVVTNPFPQHSTKVSLV